MYDLGIIGGGPAGYTAAAKMAKAGKKVVLFEKENLGGTCLNVGCIPTKTLLYSAKQYHNAKHADKYGVSVENITFDFAKMQQRKTKVIRKLIAGIKQKCNNAGCELVSGIAQVLPDRSGLNNEKYIIACNDNQYEVENILICTGSDNFVPPIDGINNNPHIWNSTDALASPSLPSSVIIIGGGVIGMEFATLYHELGISVTVIEALPSILPNLDKDVVETLTTTYQKSGIQILTNTRVVAIQNNTVVTDKEKYSAEKILISVGRRSHIEGLEGLPDLYINRGIVVDDYMQTNLPHIYAAGDVTGKIMLAHVASRQAEVAVEHILTGQKAIPMQYNAIPSVVYTNPEIASVGITATDEDIAKGIYDKYSFPMTFSGRFVAENEGVTGLCKIIVNHHSGIVEGVHMIGNPCSEFICAASLAIKDQYTLERLKKVVFPHPTVSEILKEI